MAMFQCRSEKGADTQYFSFKIVRDQRSGLGTGAVVAEDVGYSPITRWLAYAVNYDDAVSGAAITARAGIPAGTIVLEGGLVRVDQAWGALTLNIGDGTDADGWGVGVDISTAGVLLWDRDAAYNTGDPVAGTSGPQYYQNGGELILTFSANPAAGRAVVFLKTLSYNEPLGGEWT